jgi:Flp pilus assembly protein TadD
VKQEQMDAAAAHFQRAVEINPNNDDAQNNLGTIFFLKGQTDAAIVHYRQAVAVNPSNAGAARNLQAALAKQESTANPSANTPVR